MFVEFSVGNFLSFRDRVTFSMVASKLKSRDKEIDANNVIPVGEFELLASSAVYGANASGKSNLCAALQLMKQLALGPSKDTQTGEPISVEPFRLSTVTEDQPSFFQVVFLLDGKRFRYGFEVDVKRVVSEWLYHVPTTREAMLFVRDGEEITLGPGFREGRGITDKTRDNALFLSVAAQFNGPVAERILEWFRTLNIISGLEDHGSLAYTVDCLEHDRYRQQILDFVRVLDLSIVDIVIESETSAVQTLHRKFDAEGRPVSLDPFDYHDHESHGTQKLIGLPGPLMDTLAQGRVLIVDEFDARIHPLISSAIVRLFNSREKNPKNAQLVFTTHDTNLLNHRMFRRDQIWFTEKDRLGSTRLYSLAEFKVRNDASFEPDYIHGKYGAIPFLGELTRLPGDVDG